MIPGFLYNISTFLRSSVEIIALELIYCYSLLYLLCVEMDELAEFY